MSGAGGSRRATLTDAQKLDWLRLLRSENVGPATFRALVNRFGSAAAAIDALPDLSARGDTFSRGGSDVQTDAGVPRDGGGMTTLRMFDSKKPVIGAHCAPMTGGD